MKLSTLLLALILSVPTFAQTFFREPPEISDELGIVKFKNGDAVGIKERATGKIILPADYTSIKEYSKGWLIVEQNQHKGLYHTRLRKMIVPPIYSRVNIYDEDNGNHKNDTTFIVEVEKDGRSGLLDRSGRQLLPLEYTSIQQRFGLMILEKDKKQGVYFINRKKKDIPVKYDDVFQELNSDCFILASGGKYTLYDNNGNLVASDQKRIYEYKNAVPSSRIPAVAIVDINGKQSLYDGKKKAYLLSGKYDWIGPSYMNRFIVKQNGMFGIVTAGDKVVIPFQYDTLAYLLSANAITRLKASQNQRYALVSLANKALTKFEYRDIDTNSPLFTAKVDNGYTMIDSLGQRITSATYDHIGMFFKERSRVVLGGKAGYIDTKGVITTPINTPNTARGYTTLNDLYRAFVEAMKSDSDTALVNFCLDVAPDVHTVEFVKQIGFEYSSNYTIVPDEIVADYTNRMRELRNQHKSDLKSLKFLGMTYGFMEYWNRRSLALLQTSDWCHLSTGEAKKSVRFDVLIYVDGYWKAFSFVQW